MNHDDEEDPLHASMADFILHQRRLNDQRAAQAARAFMERIRAEGLSVNAGTEEVIRLRVLNLLNEKLERDADAIAERIASEAETVKQILH